jgi:hypothetical protein
MECILAKPKNATFLFIVILWNTMRNDFMIIHLIFEEDKLIAVLPANRVSDTVYPQGLTYGGLFIKKQTKLISLLDVFSAVLSF